MSIKASYRWKQCNKYVCHQGTLCVSNLCMPDVNALTWFCARLPESVFIWGIEFLSVLYLFMAQPINLYTVHHPSRSLKPVLKCVLFMCMMTPHTRHSCMCGKCLVSGNWAVDKRWFIIHVSVWQCVDHSHALMLGWIVKMSLVSNKPINTETLL